METFIKRLRRFRDARDWKKFHTPENLAKSVAIEASELLENYQWPNREPDMDNVKEEIADVVTYCLMLTDHYGFDIHRLLEEKMDKNEEKYPVDKAFGKADKYNEL